MYELASKKLSAKSINDFHDIKELSAECRDSDEPSLIVNDGTGNLIVMPLSEYQEEPFDPAVYEALKEGMDDIKNGRVRDMDTVMQEIKDKYGF